MKVDKKIFSVSFSIKTRSISKSYDDFIRDSLVQHQVLILIHCIIQTIQIPEAGNAACPWKLPYPNGSSLLPSSVMGSFISTWPQFGWLTEYPNKAWTSGSYSLMTSASIARYWFSSARIEPRVIWQEYTMRRSGGFVLFSPAPCQMLPIINTASPLFISHVEQRDRSAAPEIAASGHLWEPTMTCVAPFSKLVSWI